MAAHIRNCKSNQKKIPIEINNLELKNEVVDEPNKTIEVEINNIVIPEQQIVTKQNKSNKIKTATNKNGNL